jgi:hypothetical protein
MLFHSIQRRQISGVFQKDFVLQYILKDLLRVTGTQQYEIQIREFLDEIVEVLRLNVHFSAVLHQVLHKTVTGPVGYLEAPDVLLDLFSGIEDELHEFTIG